MGKDLASDTEAQANGLSDGKNMVPSEQETTEVGEILAANERTTLGRITLYLSGFQVESRGIERVPEDERYDTSVTNAATVVSTGVPRQATRSNCFSGCHPT